MLVRQCAAVVTTRGAKYDPEQVRVPTAPLAVTKRAYSITPSFRPPRVDGPTIALLTSVTSEGLPLPSIEQPAIEHAAIATAPSATDSRPLSFNRTLFLPGTPDGADRTRTPLPSQVRGLISVRP